MNRAENKELTDDSYAARDAFIERHIDAHRTLKLKTSTTPWSSDQRRRVAVRLKYLETMDLATRDRHGRSTVDAEVKPEHRDLARPNDIVNNLCASPGPRLAHTMS